MYYSNFGPNGDASFSYSLSLYIYEKSIRTPHWAGFEVKALHRCGDALMLALC